MLNKQKLPDKVLKNIIRKYKLGKVNKAVPLETSGNIAFLVQTASGKYILRLCSKGLRSRSKKEISAEIELLLYLLEKVIPVPRPVKNKSGNYVVSWKNHNGYLRNFIDGKEKIKPNIREIEKFGKLLGKLHKNISACITREKRRHIFDLENTKKYFEISKSKILRSPGGGKFVEVFEKEINMLKFSRKLPSGTIHEDLGKRHVLWKGNKITGIIDFDRSYYGKIILDLGQACRGWCFVKNWREWSNENLKALLKGYKKERKLNKFEIKSLADAIKFGILERALSFYMRFLEVTQDIEDKEYAVASVTKLAEEIKKNKKIINKIAASEI